MLSTTLMSRIGLLLGLIPSLVRNVTRRTEVDGLTRFVFR